MSNIIVPNRVILWENHKGNSIRNFDWKKCSPEMVGSGGRQGGCGACVASYEFSVTVMNSNLCERGSN